MRAIQSSVIAAVLLVLLACAGPASAATELTPNACRYSFDGWFRDVPVSLAGDPTIVPDPPRYPAPTEVVPGQQIELGAGLFDVELPVDLATTGAQVGLLQEGYNEVGVRIWAAIEGANTLEGVQVQGPFDVTASTTISFDRGDEVYSATPWEYDAPTMPATTWTAAGGDVKFRQAGPGSLPELPVGPAGAPRGVLGSVLIRADLPQGLFMNMDCQPGATGAAAGGETLAITPATADPLGEVAGPRNLTCLSDLGRQAAGAAAELPDGVNREIDPLEGALSGSGAATFSPGVPYVLGGTSLRFVIAPDTAATFGRFGDGGDPIVLPDKPYPLTAWVTIAAANTVEGVQTVRADTTYSLHPASSPPGPATPWDARELVIDLPATTWTPNGAGPIEFTLAPPRSMAPIELAGPAAGGPGGPVVGDAFTAGPYGSVVLRAGTELNATTLDCAPAAVSIADDGIAFSNLGRLAPPAGSDGRYALVAHPRPPVAARATAVPAPPVVVPDPPLPPPADPPGKPAAGKARLASTKLERKRGRIRLTLRCPAGGGKCAGRVALRTARKVRVGKQKRRFVTIVPAKRFSIAAGKRATLRLAPGKQGRKLLKGRERGLRVRVLLTIGGSKPASRSLTLRP